MKKYIDTENQRYQFQVINTVNGFSIEVFIVSTGDLAAITPSVAETLNIKLPDGFRAAWPSNRRDEAEKELTRLAECNGWTEIQSPC